MSDPHQPPGGDGGTGSRAGLSQTRAARPLNVQPGTAPGSGTGTHGTDVQYGGAATSGTGQYPTGTGTHRGAGTGTHSGTGAYPTGTGTHRSGTGTHAPGTRNDATAISLLDLAGPDRPPDLQAIGGLKVQTQLLVASTLLVLLVVGANGIASTVSTQRQFEANASASTQRFQDQARELGQTLSHTLSLTVSSALRDSNYGTLTEVVRSLTKANPNVVRVQVFDSDLNSVADSDQQAKLGAPLGRAATRSWVTSAYGGQPTFEYQEPIEFGSESGPGVVVLSYSLSQLQKQLATLDEEKESAMREVTLRTVGLAAGFVLLALVVAVVLSRRISKPLGQLTDGAMMLSSGDLAARVDVDQGGGREVVALGQVFNFMASRLSLLLDSARTRASLERDIQVARQVQETILPPREPFAFGNMRVAGICVSADACGGDWWLRLVVDDRKVALGLGDVTGHGLSTSLIAASATSGFVSAVRLRDSQQLKADQLMRSLNQTMYDLARGQHQMSAALVLIDTMTGEFELAAGGHPPAYVYNRQSGKLSSLTARGSLLGATQEGTFPTLKGVLRPGDLVVWYTDGVTEARNAEGRLYESARLTQAMQRYSNLPCEQLRDAVLADVSEFSAGRAQQDDMTLIVAEFGADARYASNV